MRKNVRHNKEIFDLRENIELPEENDNIIRWCDGSYVTPLEFIEKCIREENLIYEKTKGAFFEKSGPNF